MQRDLKGSKGSWRRKGKKAAALLLSPALCAGMLTQYGSWKVQAASPCGHVCDENCYKERLVCQHEHTDECYTEAEAGTDGTETAPAEKVLNCPHVHDESCYVKEQHCPHVHDESCGYSEGTVGSPCTFVCEECGVEQEESTENG